MKNHSAVEVVTKFVCCAIPTCSDPTYSYMVSLEQNSCASKIVPLRQSVCLDDNFASATGLLRHFVCLGDWSALVVVMVVALVRARVFTVVLIVVCLIALAVVFVVVLVPVVLVIGSEFCYHRNSLPKSKGK